MRKFVAGLFLALYLFGGTALHELVKLRAFIAHFQEHRAEDPDLNLLEFIAIHYFNGNIVDDDYTRDMQLPFKTADLCHFSPNHLAPAPAELDVAPTLSRHNAGLPAYKPGELPSAHLSDIWQPPKTC